MSRHTVLSTNIVLIQYVQAARVRTRGQIHEQTEFLLPEMYYILYVDNIRIRT